MTESVNSLEYFIQKTDLPSYPWITSEEMIENIRKKAYKFVSHFRHTITHDGYDRYGPQSDIHDIYVWYKIKKTMEIKLHILKKINLPLEIVNIIKKFYEEKDKFYIDRYHTEEWFVENSKPIFTLDYIYPIKTENEWKEKQKLEDRKLAYKL